MPRQLVKRLAGSRGVEEILENFSTMAAICFRRTFQGSVCHTSVDFFSFFFFFTVGSMLFVHCAQMGMPMVSRHRGQLSEGSRGRPSSLLILAFKISS